MDDKGIKIILEHDMPPQMEQFLAHTIYGSKGKLQYKHKDPAAKLKSIPGKWILHIERKASLLGTAVFIQRNTGGVLSYYVRYVSWSKQFNKSAVLAEIKVQTQLRNTTIRTNVLRLIYQKLNADERPSIMYSYIEEDNLPSFQLATSFGFQKVRTMKTLVYSRFFPKHDPHVRLLMPSEKIAMQKRLCEYYKEYSLFDSSTVFQNGSYYIYEKDGEILAGLKANPNAWSIIHMPGLEGYL
ncbi:MAG TPA: hypothetical protein VL947_08840, partial [Cytophagales bacterium]|nr:hypothetical protein [Cytophagales bacterium]